MSSAVRWALVGLLMVSLVVAASTAAAWEPAAGTKELAPRWSGPMVYRLNEAGSDDLELEVVLGELHRGMLEWTTPDCTGATARYDGLTDELPGTAAEPGADNVIAFRESDWTDGAHVVAVTATSFVDAGNGRPPVIVAATMRLNGQHWTWVADPSEAQQANLYSVTLHEGGHYWGLGHTQVPMSVMNVDYSRDLTGLASDDVQGICSLYPADTPLPTCPREPCGDGYACREGNCLWSGISAPGDSCESDADGGCDANSACADGECERPMEDCVADRDCAASEARCVAGRCRRLASPPPQMCIRDSECQDGEACKAGRCSSRPADGSEEFPVGSPCDMDAECASGMCQLVGERAHCTAFCETDRDCGSDARCRRDGDNTGLCRVAELESDAGVAERNDDAGADNPANEGGRPRSASCATGRSASGAPGALLGFSLCVLGLGRRRQRHGGTIRGSSSRSARPRSSNPC